MKYINKFFIFPCFIGLIGNAAFADVLPESMKQAMQTDYAGMPSLLNLVVSMVVVIALIYATGWVYSRLSRSDKFKLGLKSSGEIEKNKFNILSSLPLGQNKNLYAVEINNKVLILGATPQNITLLKEFDKGVEHKIQDVIYEQKQTQSLIKSEAQEQSQKIDFEDLDKNLNDISSIYKKYRS